MRLTSMFFGSCLVALSSLANASDSYTWGNVTFEGGGFVDGIVPSRTQAGLVYARTDVGGAYRWDSTGGKWIPLMDWASENDQGVFGTEALALDPSDPKKVYVLCGITYFNNGKTFILRSSDYGETFDTVNVTAQFTAHGNGMGRQTGEKLAVDPFDGNVLYCGTRTKGLFRSTDAGKTWTAVAGTTVLAGTSMVNDNGISFVIPDSTGGKTAEGCAKVVWMGGSKSGSASLWVSRDGGATFTAVTGAPSMMAMRAALAGGNLYITFSNGPGPHSQNGGSVWKYATGSGTWTKITPKDGDGNDYATGKEGYGYGFGGITVDPQDPQRLVLSTESNYGGNNAWPDGKGNAGDMIFLSEDGGATWKQLNPWGATQTLDPNGNNWISGSSIHWAGSIEFDPFDNRKVWVGSGNGVFRTDDLTATVPVWKFQSKGIEETVPLEAVSVPGGPLVTAIMDYDGATYDDIGQSVPVHANPIGTSSSLGYGALVGGFLRSGRVTDYGVKPAVTYDVLYHSADSGRTWTATDTASLPGSGGSLAMSADGKVFLLRPSSNTHSTTAIKSPSSSTFYRSADGGKTWAAVTGISTQEGRMVSDPVDAARFYIVPDGYQGDVLGSVDTGKTFIKLSSLIDNSKGQNSASSGMLRAAPGAAGDLWIALDGVQSWTSTGYSSNGLAHSTDGGKTWERITTMTACLSIGLGKAAPGADYYALYMWGVANGGPRGIYRSIDKGLTWERINDDKHQYGGPANGKFVVGDFNVYGRVYMSTAGRGLVYGNIGELPPPSGIRSNSTSKALHLSLHGNSLHIEGALPSDARVILMDVSGRVRTSLAVRGGSVSLAGLELRGLTIASLRTGGKSVATASFVRP